MAESRARKPGPQLVGAGSPASYFSNLYICDNSFVPVVATGFDDLQKRVEAQTQQAAAHQDRIKVRISSLARYD